MALVVSRADVNTADRARQASRRRVARESGRRTVMRREEERTGTFALHARGGGHPSPILLHILRDWLMVLSCSRGRTTRAIKFVYRTLAPPSCVSRLWSRSASAIYDHTGSMGWTLVMSPSGPSKILSPCTCVCCPECWPFCIDIPCRSDDRRMTHSTAVRTVSSINLLPINRQWLGKQAPRDWRPRSAIESHGQ